MEKAASIFLRADIKPNDGYNLIRWVKNENVTRYLNESSHVAGEIESLLEDAPPHLLTYYFNQYGQFYLVCDEQNRSIGFVKLRCQTGKCYEIVFAIGEECLWGQGMGKRALRRALHIVFFEKRAEMAIAKVYHKNARSIHTVSSCGMRRTKANDVLAEYAISMEEYLRRRA